MGGAERVVFALAPLREAGKSAFLPQRADTVPPAGQDLVGVALMPDIPDQLVHRRVEDGVDRHRQLDDAEGGAEMPPGFRNGVDRLRPQLLCELRKVAVGEGAEVGGAGDAVQNGRDRAGHFMLLSEKSSVGR
jgi:hypothetical protein